MFGSQVLEVAIGLVFTYLLASTMCTALREGLEGWLKTRSVYLEHGIRELLHHSTESPLATDFYRHPLISGLFSGNYEPSATVGFPSIFRRGRFLPSYIPSRNFALALLDIVARGPRPDQLNSGSNAAVLSLASIRNNVASINNPPVQRAVLSAIDMAQGDLDVARANLEAWYDSAMDRVSGWYKRSTQNIIFMLAFVGCIAVNVNTLEIADYLYQNDAARAVVVASAQSAAAEHAYLTKSFESSQKSLRLGLPVGWNDSQRQALINALQFDGFPRLSVIRSAFYHVLGWLLTAVAATLGAPFWFDILNKLMVIRSTVKPHEKSGEEASDDRQGSTPKFVYVPVAPSPSSSASHAGQTAA